MLRRMVPTIDLPQLEMHRLDKDTTDAGGHRSLRPMHERRS